MKCLYKMTIKYEIIGTKKQDMKYVSSSTWHYDELPKEEEEKYNSFDEIKIENPGGFHYCNRGFSKRVWLFLDGSDTFIKEEDLVCAKIVRKPVIINNHTFTVEDLIKKLPALEFVDWCADMGLTVI